jgi:hypothetical protein
MSAQLEHRQPRAVHLREAPSPPLRATKHASAVLPSSAQPEKPPPDVPGPDRGLSLLFAFTGALAVMVADVLVIGAVGESWILIPGFAVLLLMTAIVFTMIMRLLADSGEKANPDAR